VAGVERVFQGGAVVPGLGGVLVLRSGWVELRLITRNIDGLVGALAALWWPFRSAGQGFPSAVWFIRSRRPILIRVCWPR
jgi:hypothetical protein